MTLTDTYHNYEPHLVSEAESSVATGGGGSGSPDPESNPNISVIAVNGEPSITPAADAAIIIVKDSDPPGQYRNWYDGTFTH